MNDILRDILFAVVYLDNILVFLQTKESTTNMPSWSSNDSWKTECLESRVVLSRHRLHGPRPHRRGGMEATASLLGVPTSHPSIDISSRGLIQSSGCPHRPQVSYLDPRNQETQPLPGLLGPLFHQVQFHHHLETKNVTSEGPLLSAT